MTGHGAEIPQKQKSCGTWWICGFTHMVQVFSFCLMPQIKLQIEKKRMRARERNVRKFACVAVDDGVTRPGCMLG